MIKKITILMLLAVVSLTMLRATAQEADIISYNDSQYGLLCNPLDSFFKLYPDKKSHGNVVSSSNWKGYIATWEIKNQHLYLLDVTVEVSDETGNHFSQTKSVLHEVFPDQNEVVADWYDGLLIIPIGKMVGYVHMEYGSSFEEYLLIQVKKGEVIKEKMFNNEDYFSFRKRQFQDFKKTQEYRDIVKKLNKDKKEGRPEEDMDRFLFNYHIEYTSKFLVDLD
jgi:hypothetical protein